jgi:uncharacterized surface anchored protein
MRLKEHGKRLLAGLMGILMFAGIFLSGRMTAYAWTSGEGEVCSSLVGGRYTGSDGQYYYTPDYAPYLIYDENGNTHIGTTDGRHARRKLLMKNSSGETQQAYCIEAEVEFGNSSDSYTSTNGENSRYFQNLPFSVRYAILCAGIYGWQPGKPLPIEGINEDDYSYATQMIIWEYQQQIRTSPTDRHDNGEISGNMYYDTLAGRPAERAYNWILEQMASHGRIPSFAGSNTDNAPCHILKYDRTTGRYSLTLTDENQVLSGLYLEGNQNGISVSRNGNQYTFSTDQMISSPVTIGAQKEVSLYGTGLLIWGRPGYQTMMTGVKDPLRFFIRLETETFGTCKIVKASEDHVIAGITFHISGNGVNQSVTTDADGAAAIALLPGIYTVTEQTADRYEPQAAQTVTIASGQTATVTFSNVLKRGDVKVVKTSEDGLAEGMKFHLYGTSLSGLPVDEYAVTDAQGIATFRNILISGNAPYTLEEVDTAIRYTVPASQTAPVAWNEVTNRGFANILKKFRVTVTKSDAETGTPQGDASLAGAVYGIYQGETLVDTYTTDGNGQFTTKYYICGNDWTIREISPSEGYLLDSRIHAVGAEPELYTVEYNSTANSVHEQIIKGRIAIIKHTDNGETQVETPEAGAVFEVWRKAAGSYEAAKETERDILTCDENGFAQTKNLPYGIYTVCQTSGWDGRELMKPFDVYIRQDGNIYRYLINNAYFESYIKIVKKDVETGNVIPYAGVGFQLYDPDGNRITMTFTYPEVTEIDTFYTTADGDLITPEKLPYGTGYSIVEVEAPYGYVLNSEPVFFDVVQEESGEESGVTIIEVERSNMAQKGTIAVSKSGESFYSVSENEGLYQPVFAVGGLEGAVYEISAAEDIVTLDGTLRAAAGEIVDTVTTGADGTATSKELYLGKYEVREVAAPYGYVLHGEAQSVELVYAGQEIEITETATSFLNDRQRIEIDLQKHLMLDEAYGIGENGEIFDVAFGLYAAEDVTAADGTAIPADGRIEVVFVDENGLGMVKTDLPMGSYYVQEIATNAAYLISSEKYPVVFEYAGQDTAVVSVSVKGGEAIENEIVYGSVEGKKLDEDGKGLGGAVMGIFKPGTSEFTRETAVSIAVSAENGSFSFEKVPYGTWTIRELESPEGFLLSEKEISVTISEFGEIVEIELENFFIRGSIVSTKVDEDYPENKLAGAVFEVYADINGNGELDKEDTLLGTMAEQAGGSYRMDGLRYGKYLVREKEAPAGFVLDENIYAVSVEENGKSYVVENQAGIGFVNAAQKGSLKIVKTSSDGKVEGFSFRVTGVGYDQTFKTDKNGEISIEGLRIGEYTVSEVNDKAAAEYILPADKQAAVRTGETTVVQMFNELRDTPKTGDDFNAVLWGSLAVLSAVGAGAFGMLAFRKKAFGKKGQNGKK